MSVAAPAFNTHAETPDLAPREFARVLRRIVLLMLAFGVAQRLVRLLLPAPIWGDEAMLALNFVDRDYLGLTRFLDCGQVAPVLFLWVERFLMTILGNAEWVLRLSPFVSSAAGLFLIWDFARRTVSPTAATLAVGIMSVAVWPVSMAATVKPYAGDLFWSALLLALAARWHQRPERLWPLAGLVICVPLALASSYPTVFVAGGVSVHLLPVAWRAGRQAKGLFLGYTLAMGLTFLATYLLVGRAQVDPAAGSTGSYMRWYWRDGFPPASILDFPLWFLQANSGRMFAYPLGDANGGSAATTLLFLLGSWVCWRNGSRPLLVVCLVPFGLNLIAAVLGKYPYAGCCRLSQHLAPAICLLAGVGWSRVIEWFAERRDRRLRLVKVAVGCLFAFGAMALIHRCVNVDHDRLARFGKHLHDELSLELQPGDRIVATGMERYDACTQWYLRRFGDRLVSPADFQAWGGQFKADRVWVITMSPIDQAKAEHESVLKAAKGWKKLETTWYAIRPDGEGQTLWWYTGVTCLVRPDDQRPPPRLNVAP